LEEGNDLIDALIEAQGALYSEEMGAHVARDTPQELFHWLIGSILLSARIRSRNAVAAARALRAVGLHRIAAIAAADRADVVRVLGENGYARFDESTADDLRATARWAQDSWHGDLRRLRDAGGDAAEVRERLTGATGLGPLGARIFAREVQLVWDVFYPCLDGPALTQARAFGLPEEAGALAERAGTRERFVRLVAALTRAAIEGPAERVAALAPGA
jgi:hypothetical protein